MDPVERKSETALVHAILLAYGRSPTIRLFRNNVGRVKVKGYWIQYGLCVGSSDIIGWSAGKFVALEAKVKPRKPTPEQVAFILAVDRAGGIGAVVYSLEDCYSVLGRP